MLKKVIGILVIIAIISVGFFQKEAWLDAIKAGGMFSVLFSMLLIAADVFFPIVPFALVAALNGAVFGTANGIWITLTGSMLGTILLFFLARYSFRDWRIKKSSGLSCHTKLRGFLQQKRFYRCFIRKADTCHTFTCNERDLRAEPGSLACFFLCVFNRENPQYCCCHYCRCQFHQQ